MWMSRVNGQEEVDRTNGLDLRETECGACSRNVEVRRAYCVHAAGVSTDVSG